MCDLNGIIVVNKPKGHTSFDVIAKLRGVLRMKRLGHAGTLDPMATGVLPVFLGKATRCCDILPDKTKRYTAGFKLGIETDTQDITGKVIAEEKSDVSKGALIKALEDFNGEISQIPPMYSAVSVGGKRLYELARQGKTVERKPRSVSVYEINLLDFDESAQTGSLDILCSGGTYIRTLIHDLGKTLGTSGTMTSLLRTYSSGFSLKDSHTVEEIKALAESGRISEIIIKTQRVFDCYRKISLCAKHTALYKNGVRLRCEQAGVSDKGTYSVFGFDGEFLGLGFADMKNNELRQIKNFY